MDQNLVEPNISKSRASIDASGPYLTETKSADSRQGRGLRHPERHIFCDAYELEAAGTQTLAVDVYMKLKSLICVVYCPPGNTDVFINTLGMISGTGDRFLGNVSMEW